MLFILPGILLVGVAILVVWAIFFRAAWKRDQETRTIHARAADFERRLKTPGEPLFCLVCRHPFAAPLSPDGCPQCHSGAFVVAVSECDDPLIQAIAVAVASPPPTSEVPSVPTITTPPARSPRRRVVFVGKKP